MKIIHLVFHILIVMGTMSFAHSAKDAATHSGLLDNISEKIFEQVADPKNVSVEEYRKIQETMRTIRVEDFPPMVTNRCLFYFQHFNFVGEQTGEIPIFDIIYLNNDMDDKRNCVVLYATYNSPYPENLKKITSALATLGFDGHVIYRLGGFPNIADGAISMIEVPYAFKGCAMREAYLLGYQNVLWLDSSLTPESDLSAIFERIEIEGYFTLASGSSVGAEYCRGLINPSALDAMAISPENSFAVPHLTMCTFGLNLSSDVGLEVLNRLCQMAKEKTCFYCDWVDEAAMSAICEHMNLKPSAIWTDYIAKEWEDGTLNSERCLKMTEKRPEGRGFLSVDKRAAGEECTSKCL